MLTVWRLDRLGRSLGDSIPLGRRFDERDVGLMSVQEKIDPSSSGGRLALHMFGALAEFERTQAGPNAARARGRKGGRPEVLEPAKRRLAVQLYAEEQHTIVEIPDDEDLEADALRRRRRSGGVTCGAGVLPTRRR